MKMKKIAFTALILFSMVGVAVATPICNYTNISSIKISDLLQVEEGFRSSASDWSPDEKYLLVRCFKSISMFEVFNEHYLIDVENKTFGEIDYRITEDESKYISSNITWVPSGDKIYFTASKRGGPGKYGGNGVICNPDGTDLRAIGSPNITTLSRVIENLGDERVYRYLKISPDCNKIAFEYEGPENFRGSLWIENLDGTNSFELQSKPEDDILWHSTTWFNSTTVFFLIKDGSVMVTDYNGNLIQAFDPDNKNEEYVGFTLSPDKKKMTLLLKSEDDKYYNYISNIDGSNLIRSEIGSWQPNGSLILLNQNDSLFILEGKKHSKRLLYEGNTTQSRWFPDGNKILFIENKSKIYSIDVDGTNHSFITDIGLTSHHVWNTYDWEQISISPFGDMIVFTSALYPTGELIDIEPSINELEDITAPLFIINSDGTNLTQLTPALKGRHDFFDGWSPYEKMLTASFIQFSKDGNDHGDVYLFFLNYTNFSGEWKEMQVSQIIGISNLVQVNSTSQLNDNPVPDETTSDETENKQIPSFSSLQFISCLMGVWLLQKRQRLHDDK